MLAPNTRPRPADDPATGWIVVMGLIGAIMIILAVAQPWI